MSGIPEDIMRTATAVANGFFTGHRDLYAEDIARAILAERERWQKQDDPATTVYGRLLWRHLDASRKDFHGPERAKLYDLIEALETQFPDECAVWRTRYSDDEAIRSPERAGE